MTKVKICGITNTEDALCAAGAGTDFLGFILYPGSPRYVSVDAVALIIQALRAEFGVNAPRCVGVFVDAPVAAVREAIARSGLDLAQLHGNESPDVITALRPNGFKAIRPRTLDEAAVAYAALGAPRHNVRTIPNCWSMRTIRITWGAPGSAPMSPSRDGWHNSALSCWLVA